MFKREKSARNVSRPMLRWITRKSFLCTIVIAGIIIAVDFQKLHLKGQSCVCIPRFTYYLDPFFIGFLDGYQGCFCYWHFENERTGVIGDAAHYVKPTWCVRTENVDVGIEQIE